MTNHTEEYDAVFRCIFRICVNNNPHTADYISQKTYDKYMSIYLFKQKALQYTINKTGRHIEFSEKILLDDEMLRDDIEKLVAASCKEYKFRGSGEATWRIYIDDFSDIEKCTHLIEAISNALLARATAFRFGCCSSFIECSDLKKCLHQGNPEYIGCYYKENLEAGRIFYGKNKNIAPV